MRPILRYHGGKHRLAPFIIENFPAHRVYTEAFGGGASVLLAKPRSAIEVYNDLNGEVVNLFRQARDNGAELVRRLELTPFAREEFDKSWEPTDDLVEQARRTVVRSFLGHGADSVGGKWKTGFRSARMDSTPPSAEWATYPESLREIIARLRGVTIENREAIEILAKHDGPDTLHFVDPPYVAETRGRLRYLYEMDDQDHRDLAQVLRGLRGTVVLSGYGCPLYDELFAGWGRVEKQARGDKAKSTVEVLWIKRAA